jgi:uncharacterized protein YbjT (DUF2867 family)
MILVVGATGELGGRVARLLLERGEQVRCVVRPGTAGSALLGRGATVVPGDLTDASTLAPACDGVDVVIATATVIGRVLSGRRDATIQQVDELGMGALVDAAHGAGVMRFVYLSAAGIEGSFGSPLDRAKLATERRLRGAAMRSVIVRPDAFQEIHLGPPGRFDVAAGKVAVFGKGDNPRRWVSTDDVAALVAHVALEADPPAVLEFGGPEPLSRNAAIAVAERAVGRPLKRQAMPLPLARIGMRLLAKRNPALASVFGAGLMQDLQTPTWDESPLRERGIDPRSATEFIEGQARAAVHE